MDLSHIHQTIVENLTEAVYVRDLDMNLLYINPAAEQLVGQSLRQAKGKKCYEFFGDQEARCRERCPVERVIANGDPIVGYEHRLIGGSGQTHEVRLSKSPVDGEGTVNGAIVIMQDITRLKESQIALN
ncbi:MAG TPA: PAS domain-containing protein [Desulfomonilaceae bacterium]|nr:PAS domain-containing protein [Desulfomonilaceae bacterium]